MNKSLALAFNLDSLKMFLQQIWMLTDIFTVLISFTCRERNLRNCFLPDKNFCWSSSGRNHPNFYLYLWSCKSKKWVGDRFWQLVIKEQALLICSERNRVFYFMCQCGPGVGREKEMGRRECWVLCLTVIYRTFWLHTIAFEGAMISTYS